jgi:hypothetical protein
MDKIVIQRRVWVEKEEKEEPPENGDKEAVILFLVMCVIGLGLFALSHLR